MKLLPIDFETHYSKDYSLSKITTEEYIRSPLFQVIGVSVGQQWFSGTMQETGEWLRQFDWENSAMLAHNCLFDGAILAWHFGIVPKFYLDTLSMARPLHKATVGGSLAALASYYRLGEKGTEVVQALGKRRADFSPDELAAYGRYCINDSNLTRALFDKLKAGFPVLELQVIDQAIRMFTIPKVELDTAKLEAHLADVLRKKAEHLEEVDKLVIAAGQSTNKILQSNSKFAQLLELLRVNPPLKLSLRTGKTSFAFAKTDRELLDLLEHPDVRVQTVVAARLGVKSTIEESRTQGLLGVAQRGSLPIMLNFYGAHTGRFSGGDKLNLQNLPKRGNTAIRDALIAPEGYVFVASDLAQIEARILAYIAGQEDLVQAFREERDVYSEFASAVFGRKVTKADKLERFVGKTCILGLGYGMGAEKFKRTLELGQGDMSVKLELNEAWRILRLYREQHYKIEGFWNRCNYVLTEMHNGNSGHINDLLPYSHEGILLPSGFKLTYPLLKRTDQNFVYVSDQRAYRKACKERVLGSEDQSFWTKIYGGKVTENIVQALAAYLIRQQMVRVGEHYPVVFQVHDEIVTLVPENDVARASSVLQSVMTTPPDWAPDLPVACEIGYSRSYGGV